jgi:hypothetical protein
MYWAVVGSWTAVEAVVGWTFTWSVRSPPLLPRLIRRFPFYNIIKSLVFVYLALPQSEVGHVIWDRVGADKQGASYIYRAHLAPFFQEHERDIDVFLASLRTRAGTAFAGGLTWLWTWIRTQLNVRQPVWLFAAAHGPIDREVADSVDCSSARATSRGSGSWSISWSAVSIRTYADGSASYAT